MKLGIGPWGYSAYNEASLWRPEQGHAGFGRTGFSLSSFSRMPAQQRSRTDRL